MLNFTLTITAAPELLAALSNFTNAITAARVVSTPEANPNFIDVIASKEHEAPLHNKPEQQQTANQISQTQQKASAITVPIKAAAGTTSNSTYTQEQLAEAATKLIDAGGLEELINLLASFGVQAVAELPKEHYGAFAARLKALWSKYIKKEETK
jgi:hypothetical protein